MRTVLFASLCALVMGATSARSAGTTATAPAAPSAEIKLGYVDTSEVITRSLEFKEFNTTAQGKIDLKDEEARKKLDELKKFDSELEVMSDEKRKERMPDYNRKRQELSDFLQQSRDEIVEQQSVVFKTIAKKIQTIIETLGTDTKMTLVIDVKALLYVDKSKMVNLTDKVLDVLNSEYEKERQKLKVKVPARVE